MTLTQLQSAFTLAQATYSKATIGILSIDNRKFIRDAFKLLEQVQDILKLTDPNPEALNQTLK
jgi:hypothetical protein